MAKKNNNEKEKEILNYSSSTVDAENYLNQEIQKLTEQINSLLQEITLFGETGDLTENGDWEILQKNVNLLRRKKLEKEQQLLKVRSKDYPLKQEITYEKIDEENIIKTIQLTHTWEADPKQGLVSFFSPLGSTLINTKEGEISEVVTENGSYKIKILAKKNI